MTDAIQTILDELLVATAASRCTLREDVPGDYAFPVTFESLALGVCSIRTFRELPQTPSPTFDRIERDRDIVVMNDCRHAAAGGEPDYANEYFRALIEHYGGMAAFIAAPVFDGTELLANISVHDLAGPRAWGTEEVSAARCAARAVHAAILSRRMRVGDPA